MAGDWAQLTEKQRKITKAMDRIKENLISMNVNMVQASDCTHDIHRLRNSVASASAITG